MMIGLNQEAAKTAETSAFQHFGLGDNFTMTLSVFAGPTLSCF